MQHYEILEAFTYATADPEGAEIRGDFQPGVTGDDLTDEQIAVLENYAVPMGLAERGELEPAPATPATPPPAPSQALVFVPTPPVSSVQE